jgi:hypothetical protein
MHVLIVTVDAGQSDSLRSALCGRNKFWCPITVSVTANFDAALCEVNTQKPHVIISSQAFFTDQPRPDPTAWVRLLQALREMRYQGTLEVLLENLPPQVPPLPRKYVRFDGVRVALLNAHNFRNPIHATPAGLWPQSTPTRLEEIFVF